MVPLRQGASADQCLSKRHRDMRRTIRCDKAWHKEYQGGAYPVPDFVTLEAALDMLQARVLACAQL